MKKKSRSRVTTFRLTANGDNVRFARVIDHQRLLSWSTMSILRNVLIIILQETYSARPLSELQNLAALFTGFAPHLEDGDTFYLEPQNVLTTLFTELEWKVLKQFRVSQSQPILLLYRTILFAPEMPSWDLLRYLSSSAITQKSLAHQYLVHHHRSICKTYPS